MNKKFSPILRHDLIKGSAFVFIGNLLANFFNYLFHVMTGRMLGPEQYAIVASLISLSYVISFPSAIINTVVVRKIASLSAKKEYREIKGVYVYLFHHVVWFTLFLIILFYLLQKPIASFLKIGDPFLVFLLGVSFALSLFTIINLATIQGLVQFLRYSLLNTGISVLRDVLAFMALLLGFGVAGVMWGMAINSVLIFLLSFLSLSTIWGYKAVKRTFRLQSYTPLIWVAPSLFGMSIMLNGDVMMVKHFFPSHEAGLFGALATMGKVVFFASNAITTVLLPLAVKKHESNEPVTPILVQASLLSIGVSGGIVLFYFLFPEFSVRLLYGHQYVGIHRYVGLYGVYFLIYNLCNIFLYFYVSMHRKIILLAPFFIGISQVFFIFVFHQTLLQVILVITSTSSLLLIVFLLYYVRYEQRADVSSLHNRTLL